MASKYWVIQMNKTDIIKSFFEDHYIASIFVPNALDGHLDYVYRSFTSLKNDDFETVVGLKYEMCGAALPKSHTSNMGILCIDKEFFFSVILELASMQKNNNKELKNLLLLIKPNCKMMMIMKFLSDARQYAYKEFGHVA